MDERMISTGGGTYVEGGINTDGGPFVGRDVIINQLGPSPFPYTDLVRRARDKLKQGLVPKLPSSTSPLFYYQWTRPMHLSSSSTQEVEVWIALISNVSQHIRVLEIWPPRGIKVLWRQVSRRTEIEPFGVLSAMRYVVSARTLKPAPGQPRIAYQVSGENTPRHTLSALSFSPEDIAGLFVPLVDREELLDAIEQCLARAKPGGTAHWLAIADGWGKGRSRALAECVSAARRLGFEVLERATYPAVDESNRRDPIREAIADKLGLTGGEDDVLRLVYWLEQGESYRHLDDVGISLMAQYLRKGTELDANLRAVTAGILQRACTQPVLLAIDDLHNAPSVTAQLIRLLADGLSRIREARLVVCVTYDPGECGPELTSCFQNWVVPLPDLNESEVVEFAESWFPELEYSPDCQESLVRFLGRRPLLIRQGLSGLSRAGQIRLEQGRWLLESDFDQDPDVKLRQSVDEPSGLGMVLAEYRKLWQSEQRLIAKGLRIAAAIGVEFEYELWLQAMLEFEQCTTSQARDVRDELKKREFIMPVLAEEEEQRGMYRITPPILHRLIWQEIREDGVLASELHGLIARLLAQRTENAPEINGRLAYQLLWSQEESKMPEAFKRFRELALDSARRQHLK